MTMPDDLPAELQNLMLREVRREGAVRVCVCVVVVVVHYRSYSTNVARGETRGCGACGVCVCVCVVVVVHYESYSTQHSPVGGEQREGKESAVRNVCYVCVRVVINFQVVVRNGIQCGVLQ